jgi:DNA helicase HerA-like ATPase
MEAFYQMIDMPTIAKGTNELSILPGMANRHGLVAGATGTGKTVTLQVLAEAMSSIGVPVFAADVKGDLSGISQPGISSPRLDQRLQLLGLNDWKFSGCPVVFWDVFGKQGHPVRATVSEMGPLLLSRILNLNDTQTGVLTLVFKIADDQGLLLLDMKDLQAMLQHVANGAKDYQTEYGNISAASIGSIQRGLVSLQQQGGDQFFGEPALNIEDLLQVDSQGHGVVNILAADQLLQSPQLYATFLLWLMSELFEKLPEVGDPEKPKLVFFFDEAHLLFNDLPSILQSRIEQVIRLIRSKGVGVFFVTQNPIDVPETVLGQLGNRVQHALRAFSPRDQKAVKAAAQTFRANPQLNVEEVITQLGVGEALVSFLDEKGIPGMVDRAMIFPPHSQIGPITPDQRTQIIRNSVLAGVYEQTVDRDSAYEKLKGKVAAASAAANPPATEVQQSAPSQPAGASHTDWLQAAGSVLGNVLGSGTGRRDTVAQAMVKSAARSIGSTVGRQIVRGVLGSLLGGSSRR